MNRKQFLSAVALSLAAVATAQAQAPGQAPDALIKQVSTEVIDTVQADKAIQAGDLNRIIALVDSKVMPHVNFTRMTRIAVGRPWAGATPDQQKRLQDEFKTLLVRAYSGALTQVKDQVVEVLPMRNAATDTDVVVRTRVKGKGDAIQIDYRLEKADAGWKIYDVNVLGSWLADTSFKADFAPVVSKDGLDGLIKFLAERNKAAKS